MTAQPASDTSFDNAKLRVSWLWLIAIALFLACVFLLLLQSAMHKPLNHDEHMYVSSGVLLLHNQWPYDDYPYFQMPLLTMIYGFAFAFWPDYLLVARLINTLFAFGACALIFAYIYKLLASSSSILRFAIASSSVILYISGAQFAYTSGIAWNHDLPVLLTIASILLFLQWNPHGPFLIFPVHAGGAIRLLLLSGICMGLAISARSIFVLALLPFAATFLFEPLVPDSLYYLLARREQLSLRKVRLFYISTFGGGLLIGLLVCLPFLIASPSSFVFGNFTYHNLNEQYWQSLNYERAMTVPAKLSYSFDVLLSEPSMGLLLVATTIAIVLALRFRGQAFRLSTLLSLPIALALFVGALIPTPTWLQYFYAPYSLLALTFAICTALLVRVRQARIIVPIFALVTLISAATALPHYLSIGTLLRFDDWTPSNISDVSSEIKAHLSNGTVVTLSPIYVLQAGLNIYPALSSGPFGYRVANTLPLNTRQTNNVLSADDTVALMTASPPEAILTGAEGTLDYPLNQFATDHNYTQTTLSNGLTLWLRPK